MRYSVYWICAIGVAVFVAGTCMFAQPELWSFFSYLLCQLGLILVFIVCLVLGGIHRRTMFRQWIARSILCLIIIFGGFFVPPPLGRLLADLRFKSHLDEYSKAVSVLRNNNNACVNSCQEKFGVVKPFGYPPNTRAAKMARCGNGDVNVAFLLDTGIPLLHEGYLYEGSGNTNGCVRGAMRPEENWPYVRQVIGNWYHFSDQPNL